MRHLPQIAFLIAFLARFGGLSDAQQPQSMRPPQLPLFDWNACPFEGCKYRQWTVAGPVTLYDTWKKTRKQTGTLDVGEKVLAVTGVVITYKPGTIRLDRDYTPTDPDVPILHQGDILLTYTYRGELDSAVWFKGKYYPDFWVGFTTWPDGKAGCIRTPECAATYVDLGNKEWWAKIQLKSGRTGWVDMHKSSFGGVDVLGDR